jgi:uncharacterized iron-regulated membrane protein
MKEVGSFLLIVGGVFVFVGALYTWSERLRIRIGAESRPNIFRALTVWGGPVYLALGIPMVSCGALLWLIHLL